MKILQFQKSKKIRQTKRDLSSVRHASPLQTAVVVQCRTETEPWCGGKQGPYLFLPCYFILKKILHVQCTK